MRTTRRIAREITGKQVTAVDYPEYYYIGESHLEIPGGPGKKEQAIHEVLHWVIAEDWQRALPTNLGYGHSQDDYEERDPRCTKRMRERQELMVCHVQRFIYQLAGKPWPSGGSCDHRGRAKALTGEEVAWVMRRGTEAGWGLLVGMARARW